MPDIHNRMNLSDRETILIGIMDGKGLITSNPVTKLSRPGENRKYLGTKRALLI